MRLFLFYIISRPPGSTRPCSLVPYTAPFRSQLVANLVDLVADPDIGRIDDRARLVGGVERGFARALAEDIEQAWAAHLNVGDGRIGNEHVAHRPVELDESPPAHREHHA